MGITPLEWFKTENPLLGGVSPIHMIKAGMGGKLCKFILNQIEENEDDQTNPITIQKDIK